MIEEYSFGSWIRRRRKGLDLTHEFQPGLEDWVVGDPGRFRQMISNLVENAIKFTNQGEVGIKVRLADGGPLVWTAVVEREAPGLDGDLETRVRLLAGSDRANHRLTRRRWPQASGAESAASAR